jgi:hypothetical protein
MVDSVTGIAVGIEKSINSNAIQATATVFTTQPIVLPGVHLAEFTPRRPLSMDSEMGMPYDIASAMTPTETKALNAEELPR